MCPHDAQSVTNPAEQCRLVLLPGLGADHRLFGAQKAHFRRLEVVKWLKPTAHDEPMAHYAARLAEFIDQDEPFFLGGVSFGGTISLELCKHVQNCQGVILMGSGRSWQDLPMRDRLAIQVLQVLPNGSFTLPAFCYWLGAWQLGDLSADQHALVAELTHDAEPSLVKWGAWTHAHWHFEGELDVPLFSIHGCHDKVIHCRADTHDVLIENGGHLINLTHPIEVNQFIEDCMRHVLNGTPRPRSGQQLIAKPADAGPTAEVLQPQAA